MSIEARDGIDASSVVVDVEVADDSLRDQCVYSDVECSLGYRGSEAYDEYDD